MNYTIVRNSFVIVLVLLKASAAGATNWDTQYNGHLKYQPQINSYPVESLFSDYYGKTASNQNLDSRFGFSAQKNDWSLHLDYQFLIKSGDTTEMHRRLPELATLTAIAPNDDRRMLDLTDIINEDNNTIMLHRLDRLYINHTSDKNVWRFGRQAVSWGNGMIYNPMDFFNPFDPSAIDKEYKGGDDMIYAQHLFDNGSDMQMVWVGRRNTQGDIDQDSASLAVKYHRFVGENELDLLIAQHFSDINLGIGAVVNVGDAIMRGDIVVTRLDHEKDIRVSTVLNLSYSWTLWNKNMSGVLEYYYNGFGIKRAYYGPRTLIDQPGLLRRLQRGELFTLAQDYLATSVTIEMNPLWMLTSNVFWNINDLSTMYQLISQHDIKQNLQFLAALNIPGGDEGTEFGGIDSFTPNRPLSIEASLLAQLAWYF